MKKNAEGVRKLWNRYRYAILVALLGAGMLLWSGTDRQENTSGAERSVTEPPEAQLVALQLQLEEILSRMAGVGEVQVLLTLESDGERQLAQDSRLEYRGQTAAPEDYSRVSETVLVDVGSDEETVVTRRDYPTYRGALVVCQGGDRPDVQLAVTRAVAVLTGLSSERIAVARWQ